jgi:PKD repeat protein
MKLLTSSSRIMLIITSMILFHFSASSGNVQLNNGKTNVVFKESNYSKLVLASNVAGFSFTDINTPAGLFSMLSMDGFGRRNVEGAPALPVYRKLIEVPLNSTFSVRILRAHYQEFSMDAIGMKSPVTPAQPPLSKGDEPSKVPFIYNKELYTASGWIADDLASVSYVGTLRSLNLARVDLSPVQYNPSERKLRIYDVLEIEIGFENANIPSTLELKRKKASPYFNSLYRLAENYKPLPVTDELIAASPVTYVLVSDPMFQTTLQPFIEWKKRKGFRVIEGYTNNVAVGNTTTSIKAYLQNLYNNPAPGFNAPSFVLFVGDVAQIPAWAGSAGSHYTDLRYCEYTNDNFPEVYYGRFSATTIAQLQPQIDKTLEYEQYLMPDPSFLNEAVMVAGADASFQTHSNGQIYYGTENYFNAAHGILSHTYLQPEPSGANYSQSIHDNVSAGVAYANYTAHCGESGWASPSFVISDIAGLTNAHKYCLMVGNCCLSCKFDANSFAEEQLRAANKGSVGYIGGSNNTYWDEDFWWGCGFKTVALHPPYDPAHQGAYDGTFHDHGEPVSDWFVTQGQMVVCGNYAVEESSSSLKQYYWEIYHLMGDPSLMIYYSVPTALTATYQNPLMIGMASLAVNTAPYAYIALSLNGTLLDARLADASGAATLAFSPLATVGNLDIVITKQNRQPLIGIIQVIPATGPYVIYTSSTVSDPIPGGNNNGSMEYGETNQLNVSLGNVGVQNAPDVLATLSTTSLFITMTDDTENFGNIAPAQTILRNNAYSYTVASNIPDQQQVHFVVHAVSEGNSWNSEFNMTANAPVLQIGVMTVQDNGPGCNNDGILDPGETANLVIAASNTGHADITNVTGTLSFTGGTNPYLVINNNNFSVGSLAAGGSGNSVFSVTANALTPVGTPVDLTFTVSGGATGQYSTSSAKQVVIGLIPTFTIGNTSVTTCVGTFFDTGGLSGSYQNNENFTETFYPSTPGSMIRFTFTSFNTESGYDFLRIYNGTNTSAPLIGTYNGTTGPGIVTASNPSGALTFNFTSDASVTPAGWSATVSCYSTSVPPVTDFSATPLNPLAGQTVAFTDLSSNFPASWTWSISPSTAAFTGGTSAASQNPQVQFSAVGLYTITLTSANTYGSDSESKVNYINVTNCTVSAFPWAEGFENAGVIPNCWTQEQVNTSGINWTFIAGNGSGNPATSHGGTYNACLKDNSSADNKTLLISPGFNLAGLTQPQLKFWHTQVFWSPDQDQLSVYYRNTVNGTWTLLTTYTNAVSAWTQEIISLPGASDTYYIAFEGNAKYGYGVCIDDVEVSGVTTLPATISIENINLNGPQCFNATQTISVAGNGQFFTVSTGGSATMIAGLNILYLPGSTVVPGGYMWGYIAPDGPYCEVPALPSVIAGAEEISTFGASTACKAFPNPTTGRFRLELTGSAPGETLHVEIFSMLGEQVLSRNIETGNPIEFSLSGNPAGIYLVRIQGGATHETVRIVKQ